MDSLFLNKQLQSLRLLQLSSASLPVGAYSFSQGLEYAIDAGWLSSENEVGSWIEILMLEAQAKTDLPVLIRQYNAFQADNLDKINYWNAYLLASRESSELYAADVAMGKALLKLLTALPIQTPELKFEDISFVTAFALAAVNWQIGAEETCKGFIWSWLENQIISASKLLPMGQVASQRMLLKLSNLIPLAVDSAMVIGDEAIGNTLPGLAIASACHETQYSRLFRS